MAKILVVDDSDASRAEIANLLTEGGHTIVEATHGKEGLDVFTKDSDFNLIITDINMPVMDGLEMCEKIKDTGSKIPIVVVSSDSIKELKDKGRTVGVVGWVIKPFDHDIFLNGINSLLNS